MNALSQSDDITYIYPQRSHEASYSVYVYQPTLPTPVPREALESLTVRLSDSGSSCSCVSYARSLSPKPIVTPTNARDIVPNSWTPSMGAWVIFVPGEEYSYWGHVGVVMGIDYANQKIRVLESNYIPCSIGERWIAIDDTAIRGYYK